MRRKTFIDAVGARARQAAAGLAVAVLAAGVLTVTTSVVPAATGAGASVHAKGGCAARAISRTSTVRIQLEGTSAGRLPLVQVCIDGQGPYPFLVATGAGSSVITPALARKLRLRRAAATSVRGVTCVATTPQVKVKYWSMGGVRLTGQEVLTAGVPSQGMKHPPKGVIGSDVLSRFGAVGIDYHTRKLTVLQREAPAPKGNLYVLGQATAVAPSVLVKGATKASNPLRVFETPTGTIVASPVTVGGHTEQLSVDSGSAESALVPAIVSSLKLHPGGRHVALSGVGCKGTATSFASGAWAFGGVSLRDAALVSMPIAGTVNSGLQGILGADALFAYGAAILSYTEGHVWLTAG